MVGQFSVQATQVHLWPGAKAESCLKRSGFVTDAKNPPARLTVTGSPGAIGRIAMTTTLFRRKNLMSEKMNNRVKNQKKSRRI
jgi:hypothetical protein